MMGLFGPRPFAYPNGLPARREEVAVYEQGTTELAPLFSSPEGMVRPNPTRTDGFGNLYFYAEVGSYTMTINGMSIDVTVSPLPEGEVGTINLQDHIDSLTPHPAYDEPPGPTLLQIYQGAAS